ncbi:MAG: hypothetical protein AB8G22_01710 [Saprospiraceae bacterium]
MKALFKSKKQNVDVEVEQWQNLYGDFKFEEDFSKFTISNLAKESGWIRGEIISSLQKLPTEPESLLLPGEPLSVKAVYAKVLNLNLDSIKTTGLYPVEEVDYYWDFEKDKPDFGYYDLIISQAMLEHLINPYKHMIDLSNALSKGGHLVVHTVIPGFPYHRYPIDCMRFYPDWFEEVGNRLALKIIDKYIGEQRIMYCYQKGTE